MGIFDTDNPVESSSEMEQEDLGTGAEDQNLEDQEAGEEETGEESEESSSDDSEQEDAKDSDEGFDFKTAYKNLLPDYTRKAQELAALKKNQGQGQSQSQNADTSISEQVKASMGNWPQETQEAFLAAFEESPQEALAAVIGNVLKGVIPEVLKPYEQDKQTRAQNAEIEAMDKNLTTLAGAYPQIRSEAELGKLMSKAREIAADFGNPEAAKNMRILKLAAEELYPESVAQKLQKAQQKGAEQVLENIRAKNGAGAKPGNRKQQSTKTSEDEIGDSIVAALHGRGRGIFS